MSLAIYDVIGNFYGWRQIPKSGNAVFFGFAGCVRDALETALIAMRDQYGAGWVDASASERASNIARISWDVSASTGADYSGLVKWLNWVYVAAKGEPALLDWLRGGSFTAFDYITKTISDAVSSTASQAAETIEYGVNYQGQAEKTLLNRVLPVVGLLAACYLLKKVLD